jgi:hypothetical protein
MTITAFDPTKQIAELEVSLTHVTPKVVRVLAVPFGIRLDRLHLVFQAAMGWSNSRLYLFEARGAAWGLPDPEIPYDNVLPSNAFTLAELVIDAGCRSFKYLYDLGDEWRCSVRIQKLTAPVAGVTYPLLLAAKGRTPPEDIGGPLGYEDYLLALCDPAHERRAAYHEAYGLDFDPARIDIAEIDRAIATLNSRTLLVARGGASPWRKGPSASKGASAAKKSASPPGRRRRAKPPRS